MSDAVAKLHARVAQIRARRALVAWEIRQEAHAKGAFVRLARALGRAEHALAIDAADASVLVGEGWPRDEAGRDLVPEKHVLWVSAERAAQLASARALEIRLGPDVLAATRIALVPFASWAHLATRG